MDNNNNFKLTEPVILAFEKEKEDSHLLKKYRKNKKFRSTYKILLLRLVFIIILLYSSFNICSWLINTHKNNKLIEKVNTYVVKDNSSDISTEEFKIDFDGLYEINNSCFGWIKINNTNISYPIVKYTNNDYYLNHSFDHSSNSSGWIFADYRNACDGYDKNLIIYGHNVKNGTMFNALNNCTNKEWYSDNNNRIISIYTPTETINYEIFSIYVIAAENYYTTTSFLSDSVFQTFLDTIKSRSIHKFNVDVTSNDHILTLSTCSDSNVNRTVIHAKKVSD